MDLQPSCDTHDVVRPNNGPTEVFFFTFLLAEIRSPFWHLEWILFEVPMCSQPNICIRLRVSWRLTPRMLARLTVKSYPTHHSVLVPWSKSFQGLCWLSLKVNFENLF